MKIKSIIFLLAIVTFVFLGCSKDEGNGGEKVSGVKVTVTVTGIKEGDSFYTSFFGMDPNGKRLSWKVNGKMYEANSDVDLYTEDFLGSTTTYIGEVVDIASATVVVDASAADGNSYTVSIKVEQDGEIMHNVQKTVIGDDGIDMKNYMVVGDIDIGFN